MKKNTSKKTVVKQCIVYGCKNTSDQGLFEGDLCFPCFEYLTSAPGTAPTHSTAHRNAVNTTCIRLAAISLKV